MDGQLYNEHLYNLSISSSDARKVVYEHFYEYDLFVDWTVSLLECIGVWCFGIEIPAIQQKYNQKAGSWYILPIVYF